jgi:uncharacterized Zn finger protein
MKVTITCPRCKSTKVSIVSDRGDPTPMYKCEQCGYKHNLFPQIGKTKEDDGDEEDIEIEEKGEKEEEEEE